MDYKGYAARIEFDDDAGVLHGEVEGLRDVITFEATDVRGLEAAFRASVDDYLAQCADDGVEAEKPYSGRFLLRVDPRLHRDIAMAAARAGRSLNAFASDVFRNWIEHEWSTGRAAAPTSSRSGEANTAEMTDVSLYDVPDVPPALATTEKQARLWPNVTRNTPGSITPNTPPASRTPGKHASSKAA